MWTRHLLALWLFHQHLHLNGSNLISVAILCGLHAFTIGCKSTLITHSIASCPCLTCLPKGKRL